MVKETTDNNEFEKTINAINHLTGEDAKTC